MSMRNITVQYIGNVLFLPKLERDVKLVVERDYGTADPDKRFVMERTCMVESKIFIEGEYVPCPYYEYEMECGGGFCWDDSEPPNYCPNCGARVIGTED